ncbi:hypothetical protein B0H63DRAFT_535269 [Podospora didyma]|uniref:Peptidase C51 domain-containing protein n=1 Tax=Podospora didyma TaxID=330526 RepID=A0AAE0K262_9PEZI|nr:hypothetical protein B0H63DRAFT_535269 [Podospora didyma]
MKFTFTTAALVVLASTASFTAAISNGQANVKSSLDIPGPMIDDYPTSYRTGAGLTADKLGFVRCKSTSFVGFRLFDRFGLKDFSSRYKNESAWGDATTWDEAARRSEVRVDDIAVPGCIAQQQTSSANASAENGHVAWVARVGDGNVTVEEYNFAKANRYNKRTVPTETFKYIHIIV